MKKLFIGLLALTSMSVYAQSATSKINRVESQKTSYGAKVTITFEKEVREFNIPGPVHTQYSARWQQEYQCKTINGEVISNIKLSRVLNISEETLKNRTYFKKESSKVIRFRLDELCDGTIPSKVYLNSDRII